MKYYQVDVFTREALKGNGLAVVFSGRELSASYMQQLAQELKQFETIFLREEEKGIFRARIFTVEEELDFAGHPILGAAAAVYEEWYKGEEELKLKFVLNKKTVETAVRKETGWYEASMDQGVPEYLGVVERQREAVYLNALNLSVQDRHPNLPMEVISTGLPYLIVPVVSGIEKTQIMTQDFEEQLKAAGAKFVYVLDVVKLEGRTWDNLGKVEDAATGSAAGPAAAYLYKHGLKKEHEPLIIHQGRFVGRACRLKAYMEEAGRLYVEGDVKVIAKGRILCEDKELLNEK